MTPFDAWKARPGRPTLVALLEASQDRVFAICHEILRHRQDAEEAAQETLLEILVGVGGVRDADHYESWIKTVAFRTALDRKKLRRRRRLHELNGSTGTRREEAPFEGLHDALEKLGEGDRALLVERYFDRKTFEEMGRNRGLSDVGIRKRVEKAQDRLKRMLGGAFPIFSWKSVLTVGVAVMKTKTVAAIAIIVLPLLLLGGGVLVTSARRAAIDPNTPMSGAVSSMARPLDPSTTAGRAKPLKEVPPLEPAAPPNSSIEARFRMNAILGRLAWARGRAAECKRTARDQLTEEEGRRLQREAKQLEDEAPVLYKELQELASRYPATVVDILKNERGNPSRWNLASMIKSHLESEIVSEGAPSGPLLAGILSLETGDNDDKIRLLHLGASMERTNLEFGQVMLRLMNDSGGETSMAAMNCVSMHARKGHLKEFLRGHAARLREMVEAEGEGRYGHGRSASPIMAVAALDTPASDDFVLQRLESADTRSMNPGLVESVLHVSPRLSESQEARLHAALQRSLHDETHYYSACEVALAALSKEHCIDVLRILAASPPAADPGATERLGAFIKLIEAGELENIRNKNREWRESVFSGKTRAAIAVPR